MFLFFVLAGPSYSFCIHYRNSVTHTNVPRKQKQFQFDIGFICPKSPDKQVTLCNASELFLAILQTGLNYTIRLFTVSLIHFDVET